MPVLVRNVRLSLDDPEARLVEAVAKRLKVPASAIRAYAAIRRSLDARRHDDVHFVYHVEVALDESRQRERARIERLNSPNTVIIAESPVTDPTPGTQPLRERPVIVGFGPAGMFAALRFIHFGYKPIVLERGVGVRRRHRDVLDTFYRKRVFNPQSNLLFGEGGAGTYSDGKLYTRISDPLARVALEWFYRHGADPEILIDARPHIGSDRLPTICRRMREHIEQSGGEVRFESRLEDLTIAEGVVTHITVGGERMCVGPLIVAIGHSARDTARLLHERGVSLEPRAFQLGVRIEHPQSMVDRWQYGSSAGHSRLPPAEYHVVAKRAASAGRDCYSFCMCPGGIILPTNEDHELIATNGASKSGRSGPFANSGLVVSVTPQNGSGPFVGVDFQRKWEHMAFRATGGDYSVPAQRASDFLADISSDGRLETSYPLGGKWVSIREVIPPEVAAAVENALPMLEKRMPGFAGSEAIITGPETRASTPLRITRDPETRTAVGLDNLYPAGEGSGYAGGIISAAVDGIKTADAVIRRYAPTS